MLALLLASCVSVPTGQGAPATAPGQTDTPATLGSSSRPELHATPAPPGSDSSATPASAPMQASPSSPTLPAGLAQILIRESGRFLAGKGASTQLQVDFLDADGQTLQVGNLPLEWSSSRPQDIQVDQTGKVTALVDEGFSSIRVRILTGELTAEQLISATNSSSASARRPARVADPVQAPRISALTPSSGPTAGRTVVTLTGTGLTGTTAVSFGATPATSFTVDSATQITAVAPAQTAGSVDVSVTGPGGTSPVSVADQYSFVAAPTLTLATPPSVPEGGGTSVILTGTALTGATLVSVGSVSVPFTVDSDTQITFTAPAGTVTVNITVTTAGGISNPQPIGFIRAPQVSSLSPASGPTTGGTSVTITGSNFTGATAVSFGATPATSFTINSNTQITAVAPAAAAGSVDVRVTGPGGTSLVVLADQYTFVAGPL
ncbi:MAG: IPT/TIG domain-containing protein [Candidatus Sericytochromatia bacterium]